MQFVQIIEFTTDRIGEVDALMDEWIVATEGKRSAGRSVLGRDRDAPNRYVQVVEFPSHEAAMQNSAMAETSAFSKRLMDLCSGPPSFTNLDVVRLEEM